jgi:hypothetical protein
VADKTHEIPVMQEVWRELVVEGRVITVEALLTQRAIAPGIVAGDGDSVRLVKGNQPQRYDDRHLVFQDAPTRAETLAAVETVDAGHGRMEPRRLTTRTALVGDRDWPGLAQVFPLERRATRKNTGEQRHDVVYGVTSLGRASIRPMGSAM